jgi:hypothetical protein
MFTDENEGLPPEDYVRRVCRDMGPGHNFEDTMGTLRQDKEACFVSCWYLCSRYGLLKRALDALPDRVMLGLVHYGNGHLSFNVLRFITTKRPEFKEEREVRALIWKPEWAGQDRHIDVNNKCHPKPLSGPPPHVPLGLRRPVDFRKLVEAIVASPEASQDRLDEVKQLVENGGYTNPIQKSSLSGYSDVVIDLDEMRLSET